VNGSEHTVHATAQRAAILIVNGGRDPEHGKWLQLCMAKIREHTRWPNYRVYVWNNNISDTTVADILRPYPNVTLVQARSDEFLEHPHADALQRLYELARQDHARYIVTLDSDAHPIRACWLTQLVSALDSQTVLSGIWRDELEAAIKPYVHASCLCTTVEFIETNRLRFDYFEPNGEFGHDTLSSFTDKALEQGLRIHPLRRSNRNEAHRLIGGIYGDLIYHHGAGSRDLVLFWDELPEDESGWTESNLNRLQQRNREIRDCTEQWLFGQYQHYIDWLREGDMSDTPG
jgi:hypothetical protein